MRLAPLLTGKLLTSVGRCRLTPELALFSRAPRGLDVTVVTAFSTSRLYMLAGMCGSWRGPLSAAVYQGLVAGHRHMAFNRVQKAKAAIQELFDRFVGEGLNLGWGHRREHMCGVCLKWVDAS